MMNKEILDNNLNRNLNPNISHQLLETPLNAAFFVKNFIEGDSQSDPEQFMIEFVNSSDYFLELSNGEAYQRPVSESSGECDANTKDYKIDFKTLIASSNAQAARLTQRQLFKFADGVYVTGTSKGKLQYYCGTRLSRDLRGLTTEALINIKNAPNNDISVKDIKNFIKKLEVCKNLLFFYPSLFTLKKSVNDSDPLEIIRTALTYDYSPSFKYRKIIFPELDTYISSIYEKYFIIYKYEFDNLEFVDSVDINRSKTFVHLKNVSDDF